MPAGCDTASKPPRAQAAGTVVVRTPVREILKGGGVTSWVSVVVATNFVFVVVIVVVHFCVFVAVTVFVVVGQG